MKGKIMRIISLCSAVILLLCALLFSSCFGDNSKKFLPLNEVPREVEYNFAIYNYKTINYYYGGGTPEIVNLEKLLQKTIPYGSNIYSVREKDDGIVYVLVYYNRKEMPNGRRTCTYMLVGFNLQTRESEVIYAVDNVWENLGKTIEVIDDNQLFVQYNYTYQIVDRTTKKVLYEYDFSDAIDETVANAPLSTDEYSFYFNGIYYEYTPTGFVEHALDFCNFGNMVKRYKNYIVVGNSKLQQAYDLTTKQFVEFQPIWDAYQRQEKYILCEKNEKSYFIENTGSEIKIKDENDQTLYDITVSYMQEYSQSYVRLEEIWSENYGSPVEARPDKVFVHGEKVFIVFHSSEIRLCFGYHSPNYLFEVDVETGAVKYAGFLASTMGTNGLYFM